MYAELMIKIAYFLLFKGLNIHSMLMMAKADIIIDMNPTTIL